MLLIYELQNHNRGNKDRQDAGRTRVEDHRRRPWTAEEIDKRCPVAASLEAFLTASPTAEVYGYTPMIDTVKEERSEIFTQDVAQLDLQAVICAINGIVNPPPSESSLGAKLHEAHREIARLVGELGKFRNLLAFIQNTPAKDIVGQKRLEFDALRNAIDPQFLP